MLKAIYTILCMLCHVRAMTIPYKNNQIMCTKGNHGWVSIDILDWSLINTRSILHWHLSWELTKFFKDLYKLVDTQLTINQLLINVDRVLTDCWLGYQSRLHQSNIDCGWPFSTYNSNYLRQAVKTCVGHWHLLSM